jgi:hypothetical protein
VTLTRVNSNSRALFSACMQRNLFLNSASRFKAATCFKTRFWALFEAEKAKSHTIGCRIVVAIKLEPLAPPSLEFRLSKSPITISSMEESVS